ncbi:GNAT family N-acetyltransferase [Levilactobacillus bambusae]|uniref:N-acetyltransferase n=1 Tax=Levilactobacillus bambusae TaxID=2024736 RepID=A0A2V1MYG8_9LACO|nr:GNAT family N-acetyltransferase [Levilactobacillus bambusae]PWG00017.1 N-acetyltransferase [Levilactobacillus bambusae]
MLMTPVNDKLSLALPRPTLDGPALFSLLDRNRKAFTPYLPWVANLKSVEDEVQFLKLANVQAGHAQSLNLVIWVQNQAAGMISFNQINHSRASADIGYWLGQPFQGRGIMTASVKAMVQLGFSDYSLNRLTIEAAVENQASNRVALKAGFQLEGLLRQNERLADGRFHDENLYGRVKKL